MNIIAQILSAFAGRITYDQLGFIFQADSIRRLSAGMILAVFFMDKINGFMTLLNSGMFNRSQGDLLHGSDGILSNPRRNNRMEFYIPVL